MKVRLIICGVIVLLLIYLIPWYSLKEIPIDSQRIPPYTAFQSNNCPSINVTSGKIVVILPSGNMSFYCYVPDAKIDCLCFGNNIVLYNLSVGYINLLPLSKSPYCVPIYHYTKSPISLLYKNKNGAVVFIHHIDPTNEQNWERGITGIAYVINTNPSLNGLQDPYYIVSPPRYPGGDIEDVVPYNGGIYFVTSTGHLYFGKGGERTDNNKLAIRRQVLVADAGMVTVKVNMKLDVNDKYVAVIFSFFDVVYEKGKLKNGLCIYSAGSLKKIVCKKLEDIPQDIRIENNIVYVYFESGKIEAFKIEPLINIPGIKSGS